MRDVANDAIQLWKVPLVVSDEMLESYFYCLSSDEKARANRFKFARDRRRFVVARGTLRHLLGRELARSPQSITLCYGEYGKPSLSSTAANSADYKACNFHFNLSHSGELALCALGGDRPVGVDIEIIRPIQQLDNMIERCLSEREQTQVRATADSLRAFLQCWTCKEAYLKAIGKGLSQSMKTVEVDALTAQLLRVPNECDEGWHLHTVDLSEDLSENLSENSLEDYVGALVVSGQVRVQRSNWHHAIRPL
ncbi:MAG: 4'-phosphopantetheinyl transferase superfamily protein [Phormidesmis sp.]